MIALLVVLAYTVVVTLSIAEIPVVDRLVKRCPCRRAGRRGDAPTGDAERRELELTADLRRGRIDGATYRTAMAELAGLTEPIT
ncbi:MAG: hypothetical protein ACTHMS_16245 [Jatrophihabitans sp.]|uniref:hypothetical protein n=1 Tax=Jatrophihabitans sp. TaxID=1932789 RepID=UPI003F80B3EC